jgi:hypothetical protein
LPSSSCWRPLAHLPAIDLLTLRHRPRVKTAPSFRVRRRSHRRISSTSTILPMQPSSVIAIGRLSGCASKMDAPIKRSSTAMSRLREVADIFTHVLGRQISYPGPPQPSMPGDCASRGTPTSSSGCKGCSISRCVRGWAAKITPEVAQLLGRRPRDMAQYVADYADC